MSIESTDNLHIGYDTESEVFVVDLVNTWIEVGGRDSFNIAVKIADLLAYKHPYPAEGVATNSTYILDRLKQITYLQLGLSGYKGITSSMDVNIHKDFVEYYGADSLDLVELLMCFEEEYGIDISDKDAQEIHTIHDALSYLVAHK